MYNKKKKYISPSNPFTLSLPSSYLFLSSYYYKTNIFLQYSHSANWPKTNFKTLSLWLKREFQKNIEMQKKKIVSDSLRLRLFSVIITMKRKSKCKIDNHILNLLFTIHHSLSAARLINEWLNDPTEKN